MSVFINTNIAAIGAAQNLSNSNAMLQKALASLSSGNRIVSASDDAGGLAVSMRMSSTIADTNATNNSIADATSFLQTQDGALSVAGNVLTRISELKTMANDPTKNSNDIANYNAEFKALQGQLTNLTSGTFNGVDLFVSGGTTLSVSTSADGSLTQSITQSDLAGKTSGITGATDLSGITAADITQAITDVAGERAQNGAESSSLSYASQFLSVNSTNLQSADSLITDVDVASESTELAKDNILVQAGTSMLSQANSSAQNILKLLQ